MNMRPKKLNIDEAWKLYRLMGDCLQIEEQTMVLDIVGKIIKNVSKDGIFEAIFLMYGKDAEIHAPDTLSSLLIAGLKHNGMDTFYRNMVRLGSYGNDS